MCLMAHGNSGVRKTLSLPPPHLHSEQKSLAVFRLYFLSLVEERRTLIYRALPRADYEEQSTSQQNYQHLL